MGRQLGNIKITGTFDGLSFYNHKIYGPLVRGKTGPPPKDVKTSPRYENTRRHYTDFGGVSRNNALLRRGLGKLIKKETTVVSRLQSVLWEVLRCDSKNEWGKRSLAKALSAPAGKQLMEGYEINTHHAFVDQLKVQMIDGQIKVSWSKKTPQPKTSLHLAITVATLGIDFSGRTFELKQSPVNFTSRSASPARLSIPEPVLKDKWPLKFLVIQVKKAHKLKNEVLVKDNAECSLRILKVMDKSTKNSAKA